LNEEIYNVALRNALSGIKNALPDMNWAFILANDGTVITGDEGLVDPNISKAASSFQSLAERAGTIGGLDSMLINGEKNKVYVSCVNDMYLVAGLAKNADLVYFRTITSAVLPTVLKVLDSVTSSLTSPTPFKPTPTITFPEPETPEPVLEKPAFSEFMLDKQQVDTEEMESTEPEEAEELHAPEELTAPEEVEPSKQQPGELPSQQLIVDRFGGFMVKSDTVQLDADILKRWSDELDVEEINHVDVETFSGKSVRCKVKVINDAKLEGRGLIRIPEKACDSLDVRRGELVRVKPVGLQEGD